MTSLYTHTHTHTHTHTPSFKNNVVEKNGANRLAQHRVVTSLSLTNMHYL